MCPSSTYAELRWDTLHCGILETPVGKALCDPWGFSSIISHVLLVFTRGNGWAGWCGVDQGLEEKQLKTGFAVGGQKFCHGLSKAPLGWNLAFLTCPLLWTPSPELFHGGTSQSAPMTHCAEMPFAAELHCFIFLYFEMFSSRKKKKKKRQLCSLDWSWIVIPQSNITASQMRLDSCFPNISLYIFYTHHKAGFGLFETCCRLPAPSCSQWQLFSQLHLSHFVLGNREDIETHWLLPLTAFQYGFCITRAQILLPLLVL